VNVFEPTVAGRRRVHVASTKGEVVELDNGPLPDKHLHAIFYLFLSVFVYDLNGSFVPIHVLEPINYANNK
jgi:hypothetical protein